MISSQDLDAKIRFALDAENDEHYGEVEDIVPAINLSVKWVVSVINAALGQKKIGEEVFESLHKASVVRTSQHSRFSTDIFPDNIWTITSINPLPTTGSTGTATPSMPNDKASYLRTDLYHISSDNYAKRLDKERWEISKKDPFEAGYGGDDVCDSLKEYAYLNAVNYNPSGNNTISKEVEIRPAINKGLVTVFYVAVPEEIEELGENDIPLPPQIFNLIFDKALYYISMKQGEIGLPAITSNDIQQIVAAIQ
jgi:hypothetical protein